MRHPISKKPLEIRRSEPYKTHYDFETISDGSFLNIFFAGKENVHDKS